MKKLLLLFLFTGMGYMLTFAQSRYGFGMLIINNFSSDSLVSKEIFISKVVDLDSILCAHDNLQKKVTRKNRIYFMCVNEWFMGVIEQTRPGSLKPDSEIALMHQVERVPDFPEVKRKRLNLQLKELDSVKVSEFMDRMVAEKRRSQLLDNAYHDAYGSVIIIR